MLEKHRGDLTPDGVAGFEALIAKMEGKDPVSEDLKAYELTKTVEALRTLVMSLAMKKDHRATARYSEELYAKSSDPQDIARAAQAFAFLGDGTEFIRVIEAQLFLLDREPGLLHRYGWELFKKGRLKDAKSISERLAALGTAHRDLQLEIAIAVEFGEWESLAKPLAAFLDDVPRYSGQRSSGQPTWLSSRGKDRFSTWSKLPYPRQITIRTSGLALIRSSSRKGAKTTSGLPPVAPKGARALGRERPGPAIRT